MRFGRSAGVCIADSIAACVLPFLFAFESFGCFLRTTEWDAYEQGTGNAFRVSGSPSVPVRQSAAASSAPSPNMAVRQSAPW